YGFREKSWVIYFENGLPKQEFSYNKGELDGIFIEYWENGNIKSSGNYNNSQKNGIWKFYSISGKITEELDIKE
ncbi:MAG: toxin-antitoxin system YwqK family antitoxin, partial [Bacteroidetes bacterium]|nr:toxin-antitoxin system YwqK family antitoxin [Bacteroidota bacterium]